MFRIPKGKCTRSGGIQNSQSTLYNSLNSFTLLPGADEWGRRVLYSARLPHLRVYASKRRCLFEASAPCPAACGRAATLRLRAKSFLRLPNRELCETEKTVPNQRFGTVFLLFLGFFGGAEGLQALLDEVGDGAAADAVVMEENRQFGYLNPCTDDTDTRQKSGQVVAGGAIGVLCHEKIWFPTLPGNVMNA